jgi:prepilin-type N-terminal cleavage/methylation domain-containing protein
VRNIDFLLQIFQLPIKSTHHENQEETLKAQRAKSFTLIELLVVLAILAVLISLLGPSLSKTVKMAERVECGSNKRQVGAALYLYVEDFNGLFPNVKTGDANHQRGYYKMQALPHYLGAPTDSWHYSDPEKVDWMESSVLDCPTGMREFREDNTRAANRTPTFSWNFSMSSYGPNGGGVAQNSLDIQRPDHFGMMFCGRPGYGNNGPFKPHEKTPNSWDYLTSPGYHNTVSLLHEAAYSSRVFTRPDRSYGFYASGKEVVMMGDYSVRTMELFDFDFGYGTGPHTRWSENSGVGATYNGRFGYRRRSHPGQLMHTTLGNYEPNNTTEAAAIFWSAGITR